MSITCSIPGCNGKNSFSEQTKLYRVPALAVGSDGMIFDLTKRRRKKWFEALQSSGLNEFTAASYRVCSNHFVEGKPSPLFDNRSRDWAPTLNLHDVTEETAVVVVETGAREEPTRGRPRKKNTTEMGPPSHRKTTVRSKSVGSSSRTPNNSSRRHNIGSGLEDQTKDMEQPFVFVDIQKIREGTPVPVKEATTRPQTPVNRMRQQKCRKQPDPRFISAAVQTDPTITTQKSSLLENNNSIQACLGEIIEFIRKQILDFNLKTVTNSFKIKECALNFEKEGEAMPQDKEANTVVVLPNRLLSSNWPLLESVAMSLDLHRLKQKNDEASANYVQTLAGKTETIRQINTSQSPPKKRRKSSVGAPILPPNSDDIDLTATPTKDKPMATSPILPKISSVVSLGELMNEDDDLPAPKQPKTGAARSRKKLVPVEVPPVSAVPSVSTLAPRNPVSAPTSPVSAPKSPIPAQRRAATAPSPRQFPHQVKIVPSVVAKKRLTFVGGENARRKLGTDKIARVIIPKLPDSVYRSAMEGKTITLNTINTPGGGTVTGAAVKTTPGAAPGAQKLAMPALPPSLLWMNRAAQIVDTKQTVALTNEVTNTPLSFKSVKNIPLKLPQAKGVAGYLLVPATNSPGGASTPIVYVPNVEGATPTALMSGAVVTKGGVAAAPLTTVVGGNANFFVANRPPAENNAIVAAQATAASIPAKVAIPRLPPPTAPPSKEAGPKGQRDEKETTLRCPYCLKRCKDGLEFINHHNSILCRKYRTQTPANDSVKCENCHTIYRKNCAHKCRKTASEGRTITCNVCGRSFTRTSGLANHVKCHPEYADWFEKCLRCPLKFPNAHQLRAHVEEKHPPTTKDEDWHSCEKCDKKFSTPKRLQCHVEKSHSAKKKLIKVRCKYCSQLIDLQDYKKCHWKECKSENLKMKREEEEREEKEMLNDHKKPTAIRSRSNNEEEKGKKDDPIEEELSKLFAEQEEESSEYEQEELLTGGYDEEEEKIMKNNNKKEDNEERVDEDEEEETTRIKLVPMVTKKKNQKKKKRFMNLEGSDSEEDFDEQDSFLPSFKIQRIEKKSASINEEKIVVNKDNVKVGGVNEEEEKRNEKMEVEEEEKKFGGEEGKDDEGLSQKIDFKSLLGMIGGENDIDIEEMEDEEEYVGF